MADDLRKEIARLEARILAAQSEPKAEKPKKSKKVEIVQAEPKNTIVYEAPPKQEKPPKRSKKIEIEMSSDEDEVKEAKKAAMKEKMAKLRALRGKKKAEASAPAPAPAPTERSTSVKKQRVEKAPETPAQEAEKKVEEKKKIRMAIRSLDVKPVEYDMHICDCPRCKEKHDA